MNGLQPDQLATLQATLEQRKTALLGQLAGSDNVLTRPQAVEEIEASPADNASNHTLNQLLLEADELKLAQLRIVRHALAKFADGSYGLCENCGGEIGVSRLTARPEAAYCIACQTRSERAQR
ncbi:TraR/DksA family transcriptional regulator [Massilia sp. YIM B04103]|uniref:TraR/DksA family transcriptional regulator n=1 Tax=Massilia sp. YIM B04103 TaxID=2963106 RepID=UPI00210AF1F6|nr:TraR/DksA family transcriptional regulator [Massilia sp. YIM B04103]